MEEQTYLVPKRRFKEFHNTPAWEQRKLSEMTLEHNAGIYIEKSKYGSGINIIGVGNLYDNDIVDGTLYRLAPVTDKRFILAENDLLYGESSLVPEGIARTMCVDENGAGTAFAWHTRRFKVDNKILNSHFLTLQLNYVKEVRNYLMNASTQTALTGMTTEGFFGTTISFPKLSEQEKISGFFKQIDSLINLHQRKLEKTKALKSAYLSEMFPAEGEREPKRRFAGFTQAWEERHFIDNIKNTIDFRGRTPKKLGLDWSETGYLALSAFNVKNGYIDFSADAHYGNQELYDKWMTGRELRKGQVLFTTEAPMGNVAQVPDDKGYILSQRTIAFDVNPEKITDDFLAVLLRSPKTFADLSALSSGGTAKGVSQKSISQLKVTVPKSLEEQAKIGAFFKNIDHLITLHQRKLGKLQNLKKAYLNEMFV